MRLQLVPLAFVVACTGSNPEDPTPNSDPVDGCGSVEGVVYATIQEAVDAAEPGATVSLCGEAFEENVIVDHDLVFEGDSIDTTLWSAPANEDTLSVVNGATVTLSDLTLTSTRSALHAENATVQASSIVLADVGTYGIKAVDSTVTLSQAEIDTAGWGGILIQGGSLALDESTIRKASRFGLKADLAADITVSNSTIRGTDLDAGNETDGYAVWITGASTATLTGNTYVNNDVGALLARDGLGVTITDELVEGGQVGIFVEQTPLSVTGLTIDEVSSYGIALFSVRDAWLEDLEVLTNPETSVTQAANRTGSIGLVLEDSLTTVVNATITGNNGYGILQQRRFEPEVALTMENVVLENNARASLAVYGSDVELTDVDVRETRSHPSCVDNGSYTCNFAVLSSDSTLVWNGGSVTDNPAFGLVSFAGALDLDNLEIANNALFGVTAQASAMSMSNSTFTAGGTASIQVVLGGYAELDNVTFSDNQFDQVTEETDSSGNTITDIDFYSGIDLYLSESAAVVDQGTFSTGDQAIYAYNSDVTVSDSTFSDYNQYAVYLYGNDGNTADLSRTSIENLGGNAVYAIYGTVNLDQVEISNLSEVQYRSESYTNGTLTSETTFSYVAEAIYVNQAAINADDVTIDGVDDRAIYLTNGSGTFSDLTITDAGRSASTSEGVVQATFSSRVPDLTLIDVTIPDAVNGNAIRVTGSSAYPGGSVDLLGLSLGNATTPIGTTALVLDTLEEVSVRGLEIQNTAQDGVLTTNVDGTINGTDNGYPGTISNVGASGLQAVSSSLKLDDLTISGAALNGVRAVDASLNLDDVAISDTIGAGMYTETGSHALQDTVSITGGTVGLECVSDPVFSVCDAELSGPEGASLGCATCP